MTMIGNIKNQDNRDFEEIGKIGYFPKSVNGSKTSRSDYWYQDN